MQVVASAIALASVATDEGSEVALVGRLVVGETCITREPIYTCLGRLVRHTRIEGGYAEDDFLHIALEGGASGLVFRLVVVEPIAVVVFGYLPQKSIDMLNEKKRRVYFVGAKLGNNFYSSRILLVFSTLRGAKRRISLP